MVLDMTECIVIHSATLMLSDILSVFCGVWPRDIKSFVSIKVWAAFSRHWNIVVAHWFYIVFDMAELHMIYNKNLIPFTIMRPFPRKVYQKY